MEEAPENGKKSLHSAHDNGMNDSWQMFNFWDVILDLNKYILPRQMCVCVCVFFLRGDGHLRLESSCIQVNTVIRNMIQA